MKKNRKYIKYNTIMKTTIRFILIISALVLPVKAVAQVRVMAQAFDVFYNRLDAKSYITTSENASFGDKGYMKSCQFAFPASKDKDMSDFLKAISGNKQYAYKTYSKKEGMKSLNTMTVAAGDSNGKIYEFGAHADRNYDVICMYEAKDSTMRYVYALVWYKKGKVMNGSIYKFYGKKPESQSEKTKKYSSRAFTNGHETIVIGPNGSVTRNGVTTGADGLIEPKDHYDFMQQYSNMVAVYVTPGPSDISIYNLRMGLLNKMLRFCGKYAYMLSNEERIACRAGIETMRQCANDEYSKGLMDVILSYLRSTLKSKNK